MRGQPAEPFFWPRPGGHRLCMLHRPAGDVHATVLHVHPWAEEMNKSRRMAALTARALAAAGCAVLQMDLYGCGDSSGDFADATWDGWVDDVRAAALWLRAQHPRAGHWLWGHRAGALLAVGAAPALPADTAFVFWQPALNGKTLLQQFLRLRAAAEMSQGDGKSALERVRADLAAGRTVDIAGYALPPALAQGLESAALALPHAGSTVHWLETSTRTPPALLPASVQHIDAWRRGGHTVTDSAVAGPAFWQTQEIEDAPALVDATVQALAGASQDRRVAA